MLGSTSLLPLHDENPTRTFSFVTAVLIAVNILAFLSQPGFGQVPAKDLDTTCSSIAYLYKYGVIPSEVTSGKQIPIDAELEAGLPVSQQRRLAPCPAEARVGQKNIYLSLLTSIFLHGGFLHLGGNMLFLWVFGNNIEDRLGKLKFIILYLMCGLIASGAHIYGNPASAIPTIGASGAVAGMLGAYIVLFPRARIVTIVPIFYFLQFIRIPAILFLGIWFGSQFLIGAGQQVGGAGVAWLAHVGGFLAGAALIIPFGGRKTSRRPARFS